MAGTTTGPDSGFSGLKIWASWKIHNCAIDAPTFKGAATIAMARGVYGVPNPDGKQLALL